MAAAKYYSPDSFAQDHLDQQHLLENKDYHQVPPGPTSPLKPLHLLSHYQNAAALEDMEHIKEAQKEDAHLKASIRRLRFISRLLAFLVSLAVLVPITMTLVKFLQTQHTYRTVTNAQGKQVTRTAWARNTKSWPTWMYFAVAAVSVLLNFITVFSYKFGVEKANKASYITSIFGWVIMLGNLVVWSVAASLYRTEKDKNGKSNDLWGWTCSAAARAIQKEFADQVDFNKFCGVQSASFYIGVVQAGAALLTVFTYVLVLMRNRSKKYVRQQTRISGYEPSRR